MKRIESPSNPFVKTLRRLAHPRKRSEKFLLEGTKLVSAAVESRTRIEAIAVASSYSEEVPVGAPVTELSDGLFRSVSSLESPEGVMAVALRPTGVALPETGVLAVAAGIHDPGNLGAVARVAEASGASALVVLAGSADPFGPKAVRGSMGSVLRLPVIEMRNVDELRGFRLAALVPRGGEDFRDIDWSPPVAIVLGGESSGIEDALLARCELRVSIPMQGGVESLNVAAAAALVLYEAARKTSRPSGERSARGPRAG